MVEPEPIYDVAISFLGKDEAIAKRLSNHIN